MSWKSITQTFRNSRWLKHTMGMWVVVLRLNEIVQFPKYGIWDIFLMLLLFNFQPTIAGSAQLWPWFPRFLVGFVLVLFHVVRILSTLQMWEPSDLLQDQKHSQSRISIAEIHLQPITDMIGLEQNNSARFWFILHQSSVFENKKPSEIKHAPRSFSWRM